nr:hypothetical protein [Tanacetum cinerariifolium]
MAPKQARTTRANPNPTTTATKPMTQEAINNLIAQRVTEALAEYETQRNSVVNGDTSHTTGTRPRTNSHIRAVSQEVAYAMPWKTLRQMMTAKYCLRGEVKKLEVELWNLKVKGTNITSYTLRFQELALLCGRMFPEESDEIERYVGGLPERIRGNVMSYKPKSMQQAIEFANDQMDQKILGIVNRQADNKKKFDNTSRNQQNQQSFRRNNNVARAYAAVSGEKKPYGGTKPLCPKYNFHHDGPCGKQKSGKEKSGESKSGGEWKCCGKSIWSGYCRRKPRRQCRDGIKREFSIPKTPQQNGIAEKKNQTLIEAARIMLPDSFLPITFWAEVVNTACYVQNRVLVTKPHNETPYELLHGNQSNLSAGVQEQFDAEKAGEENKQQYVLFPVWSSGSTNPQNANGDVAFEGKEPEFDEKKPESEVNVSPSSSVQSKKHDDKTKKKAKGKSPVESFTGYRNLSADFEDFFNNSINEVNAVGILVPAVGKIFPNSTNTFSAAGPSNAAASPTHGKSSCINTSQLPDDPDMPELEDITYSDDQDDVGAEANFNNLETSIIVSLIPTIRVHKNHHVTQIVGDLSSATQTRSMTRVAKDQGRLSQMFNDDFYTCMFSCFLSQEEPKRVHQALKDPSWIKAMKEELLQFKMQKVWVLVDLPYGKRAIGTKWVFNNKKDERGIIVRNQARLVAQQEERINYEEVFAPVARIEAIRLLLAYASFIGFMMYQMDVKSAFLYGTIEEEKKDGIFISQDKYVAKILRKFRLTDGKSVSTPIDTEKPLLKDPDVAYSDSDYAGASLDRKSTTGGCQFLVCRLISWQCEKKTVVATSSTEAEYVAVSSCCAQVLWIQNQLLDYSFGLTMQVVLSGMESLKRMLHVTNILSAGSLTSQQMVLNSPCLTHTKNWLFWTTFAIKNMNDITRLQALVDKKKVVVIEATIRDVLRLDDAEGVECLPNEEIFAELARMGYEKPSTKLSFYKAFFSSQWKFLIHTILQCMSAKRTSWNEFSSSMASAVICLSLGKGFSRVETPLFRGLIVEQQVSEGDADEVHGKDVNVAGVVTKGVVSAADDVVPTANEKPSIPSPTPPTTPPQPSHDIPSTSQDAGISMNLLQELIDTYIALTRRVEHLELDKIAQALEITKFKQRFKKLERMNKLKVLKLRRLKRVGLAQRIDTSDDTVMDDVSKPKGIIKNIDADEDVVLEDAKDVAVEKSDDVEDNDDIQGRTAESQAKIYKIDLDHANKVLSMQEEESEPIKLQEVVDVVTTAKIINEVITAASKTITAVDVPIPASTTNVAPTLTVAPSRRTKEVVIRDPEESTTTSTIIHSEAKSKDKEKGILVEEPKPLKKQARIKQDEKCARELEAEFNRTIDWDETKEQMDEEDSRALKRLNEMERRYPLTRFTLDQMLNNVRLEVEEESEVSLELLRPISLIGSMYKIILKILANRLVVVFGGLVNEIQSAFVADKQIIDGSFILNELVQWCKKKKKQSLVFKVDFEMAYDSVRWDHLDDIMRKFGFGEKWLDVGLFKGIELAPSLNLSHTFYADDAIFMGQWSKSNIDTIVKVLNCFNRASGLRINMTKRSKVGGCMSCIRSWNETIERMACRLSKWKLKTHSIGDKGGLGVSSLFALNKALMFKWLWHFITQGSSLWARVIKVLHGYDGKIGQKVKSWYPSLWLDIIHEVEMFKSRGIDLVSLIHSKLGNGANTSFWEVTWHGGSPFKSLFPRLYALETQKRLMWHRSYVIQEKVDGCILVDMMDRWFWALEGSAVMSSASSMVTYTSVYTDFKPGRVFWGADEELSDRVPQDEDKHEPMFIQPHDPDYVPEPMYPEYIPLEDEHVLPAKEHPLPPIDSPTAKSSGYVVESDPKEDPKEYEDDEREDGPVDYHMDGGDDGDDNDDDSSVDDADDEDKDEEDEEEEEEEHLAPADSAIVIPTIELVSLPEGTKPVIPPPSTDTTTIGARITVWLQVTISLLPEVEVERLLAMPTLLPSPLALLSPPSAGERLVRYTAPSACPSPPPIPSPLQPSSGCPTQIQTLRMASTHTLIDAVTTVLPSPPLSPPLYIPPPVDHRDDIPEIEMPPRKRLCLSTIGSRYVIGESYTARPTEEVGYGIRDTWVDPAEAVPEIAPMTVGEVNTRVTELAELYEHDTHDLYALLEDA